MKYPTCYIRPKKQDRLVREVVYEEMSRLTEHRVSPDVLGTCLAVKYIEYTYKRLDYSLPELLCSFQEIDLTQKRRDKKALKITAEMVPWETVPVAILERCLDENMELRVTDELLVFLKMRSGESIFDRVEFPSRVADSKNKEGLLVSPLYDKRGRLIYNEYYLRDEKTGEYRRAIVMKDHTVKTPQELEYVVDHFSPDSPQICEDTGLDKHLLLKVIHSIGQCISAYRAMYFRYQFIEEFKYKTVDQLHEERRAAEREYAVSRNGTFTEDTAPIWKLVERN